MNLNNYVVGQNVPNDKLLINAEQYRSLKSLYAKAVKDKMDQFIFQGKDMLTSYAKYLIEFLKPNFEK